jgi:hypothetical protein
MADEAPKTPIPQPTKDDHEDVSWALSTAEATWNRGDRADALKWLRRAAESASEAEQDDRALQLAKAAAELASQLDPSTGTSSPPNRVSNSALPPPITRPPMTVRPSSPPPPVRSVPPPLPGGAARGTKPPALPPGKGQYLAASPLAETMVSQQPIQPIRKSVPPAASKVEVQPKAPSHSAAPRPAAIATKPTVKTEAVRTTARYSEAPKEEPSKPDAAKAAAPKASDSSKNAVGAKPATASTPAVASSPSPPTPANTAPLAAAPVVASSAGASSVTSISAAPPIPPTPTTSPDVERAQRLSQMARAAGDDTAATWTGAEDRPSEPETPQSKRGANGNGDRVSTDPKTPAATLVEDRGSRGKYGPPTTRFTANATVAEMDAWPTAALTGDEVPSDFHDENKTRIDAPAYKDSDDLYDGSAIVPPKTGDVRPTQAVRVIVWRAADGVHVAPHGTTVSAISVDAMLVALDPTADLFAWLKGK